MVRQKRLKDAERSLRRLQSASATIDVKQTLASIVHTNHLEEELSIGTSYWDCFTGFELRRTEIACVSFAGQILSGLSFAYNASYFFEQVGLDAETTYSLNILGTTLAFVGTLVNWFYFMPYMGRRNIYLLGAFVMAIELFLIGVLNVWTHHKFIAVTQAALTLVWTFTYQCSVGQLGWSYPAEVGSTRLRQKTVCLARNAYYVCAVISGSMLPFFLNPEALNLRGYTGFIWGTTALLTWIWAYFRLPETRGRTYEELDVLFAKGVPARRFATTNVDAFDEITTTALAQRYHVDDLDERRPRLVPRLTGTIAERTGRDKAYSSRRNSVEIAGSSARRRSSSIESDRAGLLGRE